MTNYSHIAHRVFNKPHLVEPSYARVFVGALSDRLDVRSLMMPDGTQIEGQELRAEADGYRAGGRSIVDAVDGIAIIPVEGTLMHKYGHVDPYSGATGYDGIQAKLEEALDDPSIRGILLDIHSPGGEVSGCFDLADFIYESRAIKPIWAVADELAASAAFAIASSAERVIAPRTADLGSVGVLTMHVDQSQMVEEAGLNVTFIYAGDHKIDGNPFEPLPDDVRADIQAEIDEVYNLFTSTVARNRGMSEQAVRDTQARVYNARDSRAVGFADDIMASRKVMSAFDQYLNGQDQNRLTTVIAKGVSSMSLPFKGRGRKGQATADASATEDETTGTGVEATGAEDSTTEQTDDQTGAEPEGSTDEGQDSGEAGDDGQETDPTAQVPSAERVVSMCTEAHVPQLANSIIKSGVTLAEAQARLNDARGIRDACAAAGVPHLADQAVEAIDQHRFADFVRSMLTELTADAAGEEVEHHQPTSQPAQGKGGAINAVQFYQQNQR